MKRIRSTNVAFFLLVVTAMFVPFAARALYAQLNFYQDMIISEVIFVLAVLAAVALFDRSLIGEVQQNFMHPKTVLLVIAAGILIQPIMTWLNLFSMFFVKNYVAGTMSSLQGSFWVNLLYIALAPAVAEEFIFRGVIFHGYRQLGIMKAALLSGLLFGLMHMNMNQFVYAFGLGVILALLLEVSGSIYAPMLVHFMVNAKSVIIQAAYNMVSSAIEPEAADMAAAAQSMSFSDILQSFLIYTPIALGCAAALFFVMRRIARVNGREEHFYQVCMEKDEDKTLKKMPKMQKFVLYLPMLIGVLLCVCYMIWIEIG